MAVAAGRMALKAGCPVCASGKRAYGSRSVGRPNESRATTDAKMTEREVALSFSLVVFIGRDGHA